MSNIAGKAYAMNVLTPSRPAWTWLNRLIFMFARANPSVLAGLMGLSLIHFARWVIVKPGDWPNLGQGQPNVRNDYMIFCSNFNGTWDQYIDAFSDGIPSGLNLFWYSATKYPKSIPITPFKDYICHNQFDTNYYYNATPGSAQRDIKSAIKAARALRDLARHHAADTPEAFAERYRAALVATQDSLGDAGFAPVASLSTEFADLNRKPFVQNARRGA